MNVARALICAMLVGGSIATFAQQDSINNVLVSGKVMAHSTLEGLYGAKVSAWQGGKPSGTMYTDSLGNYWFYFDYGYECLIRYEAQGRVSKLVSIDTRIVQDRDSVGPLDLDIDMTLFKIVPGADFSVLQREPIGKARVDTTTNEIAWDLAHRERMRGMLNDIMPGYGTAPNAVDNVYLFGRVKDYVTSIKLVGVEVSVWVGPKLWARMYTDSVGKYEFKLDYDYDYIVRYELKGLVSKYISIDARNIPEQERLGGHGMNVEMTLFKDIPGVDFSVITKQPIGKARFDPAINEVTWDLQYTERIRSELSALMGTYGSKLVVTPDTLR